MIKENTRFIECECGATEEFYADMPRDKTQYFELLKGSETDDNNATYICPECNAHTKSVIL